MNEGRSLRGYRHVGQLMNKNDLLIILKIREMDLHSMNKDMLIKLIQTCRKDLEEENKKQIDLLKQCDEEGVKFDVCKTCNKLLYMSKDGRYFSFAGCYTCWRCRKFLCEEHRICVLRDGMQCTECDECNKK